MTVLSARQQPGDSGQLETTAFKLPKYKTPPCLKASASLTPHVAEIFIESSPLFPCLSAAKLLLAQREGPYQLIRLALSSVLWILHPPLSNYSHSFALSLRGVTRTKTSEAADGEDCRCGSGEGGGGQVGGSLLRASVAHGVIATSGNFGITDLFTYRS